MHRKFIIIFCLLYNINSGHAESNTRRPEIADTRQDIQISRSVIKDIKSDKPFVNIEQERVWDFQKDKTESADPDLQWLTELINFVSMLIEAVLWFIPVVIIFYLYRYREYWLNLMQGSRVKQSRPELPEALFGLDIRQQSLPDDIENTALELWQQKQFREAVSLLYRGSLLALFKQYQFELPAGATEQDCIYQIELNAKKQSADSAYNESVFTDLSITRFKELTRLWISIAYAHQIPDETDFRNMCNDWNRYFAAYENAD